MKKYAQDLAREYDFNHAHDYFEYIIESLINGNRQQVRDLFNAMHKDDQQTFLVNYLDRDQGYHLSVLNICIIELTQ